MHPSLTRRAYAALGLALGAVALAAPAAASAHDVLAATPICLAGQPGLTVSTSSFQPGTTVTATPQSGPPASAAASAAFSVTLPGGTGPVMLSWQEGGQSFAYGPTAPLPTNCAPSPPAQPTAPPAPPPLPPPHRPHPKPAPGPRCVAPAPRARLIVPKTIGPAGFGVVRTISNARSVTIRTGGGWHRTFIGGNHVLRLAANSTLLWTWTNHTPYGKQTISAVFHYRCGRTIRRASTLLNLDP